MVISSKLMVTALAALAGAGILCPLCGTSAEAAAATGPAVLAQGLSDTATVRLHISGMTCGSCPVTARLALQKLAGVYSAKVTLDDSLGVIKYDPAQVTPPQIAEQLTRLTGYGARVLAEPRKPVRPVG